MNVENAIKKVKDNIDRLLDKNMTDMIRGIRNNKENEVKYISQCLDEIKIELKQDNMAVKANAILKLTYLNMLGYSIGWASFNIVEVMSSTKFTFKRIGYLAASQCFHNKTDVLMLTTNLIKKDINSSNQFDAAVALNGLSCFVTPELARDLSNDITSLMSSTKPYVRKRAILMMYKIFLNYSDSLEYAFVKMKDKLEDSDQSVQSAVVNVVCEMARRNPKNYLSLAPIFFKLMTTSTNNWMLIKIIKLFGTLTSIEPRLGKKLLEPLTSLIHSTSAMSLLYECINTLLSVLVSISSGKPDHSASIQLCLQKLRILIEDNDQNLKYLGLLAMSKILKTYPKSVQAHKDIVLKCLNDKDDSIRLRALHLLYGMVNKKNLAEIVKTLLSHLCSNEGSQSYKDELLKNIVHVCSQKNYQYISDFEWYLNVLIEFTRLDTPKNIDLIASQLLDVTIRVPTLRKYSVLHMEKLLDPTSSHLFSTKGPNKRMSDLLYVVAYICGEFSQFLENTEKTIMNTLDPRLLNFSYNVQGVCLWNGLKILAKYLTSSFNSSDSQGLFDDSSNVFEHAATATSAYPVKDKFQTDFSRNIYDVLKHAKNLLLNFTTSDSVEIQERVFVGIRLIEFILVKNSGSGDSRNKSNENDENLKFLFEGDLNPVAPTAQTKVTLPPNFDLDEPINPDFDKLIAKTFEHHQRNFNSSTFVGYFDPYPQQVLHRENKGAASSKGKLFSSGDSSDGSNTLSSKESDHTTETEKNIKGSHRRRNNKHKTKKANHNDHLQDELNDKKKILKMRQARLEEQASNPHYLKSRKSKEKTDENNPENEALDKSKITQKLDYEKDTGLINLGKLALDDPSKSISKQKKKYLDVDLDDGCENHFIGEDNNHSSFSHHKVEIIDYERPEVQNYSTSNLKNGSDEANGDIGIGIHHRRHHHHKKSLSRHKQSVLSNTDDNQLLDLESFNDPNTSLPPPEPLINGSIHNLSTNLLTNNAESSNTNDYDFWISPLSQHKNKSQQPVVEIHSGIEQEKFSSQRFDEFAGDRNIFASYHVTFQPNVSRLNVQFKFGLKSICDPSKNQRIGHHYQIKNMEFMIRLEDVVVGVDTNPTMDFEMLTLPYLSDPPNFTASTTTTATNTNQQQSFKENFPFKDNSFFLKIPHELVLKPGKNEYLTISMALSTTEKCSKILSNGCPSTDVKSHQLEYSLDGLDILNDRKTTNIYSPPLTIKGYFSYILNIPSENTSESLKFDFKYSFPAYDYLFPATIDSQTYKNIVSKLNSEETCKILAPLSHNTFHDMLKLLDQRFCFRVIEEQDQTTPKNKAAILYSKSIFDPNICLFLKVSKVSSSPKESSDFGNTKQNHQVFKLTIKGQNKEYLKNLINDTKSYLKNFVKTIK